MQLLIAGSAFGLLAPVAFAATVTSTATGGNWNTGSTWVGGTAPAAGDTAVIATTGGNSVTITANATIANLTVNSGSTLAFSGSQTLTFGTAGGGATVNGTVNGSGTLVMNKNPNVLAGVGTINSLISAAQPTSVSASSNLTVNGTIAVGNTFTINAGAMLNASTINSNGKTVANNGTVNLSGNYARTGGTAIWTQGTSAVLNIGGIFTPSANVTLTATGSGNTVNYNGSAQAIKPASYVNLTLSGSGIATLVTGTSVSGTMNIAQTGSATASIGAGLTLTVANLTLGGLGRINGTWGSTSSTATYQNNTYFAATTGKLSVTNDTRATPTISVSNSPVTYSGAAQAAVVTGSVSGTASSILYGGSGTTPTNAGTYAVTANFTPTDGTSYKSLTGASAGNFIINQATTTTSVATSGTPTVYGTTVTFTATVAPQNGGAPSGTVTFKDGATIIGTGTLGGGSPDTATYATAALSARAHSITAVYAGDSNYVTSTSGPISQSVTQKTLTISGITANDKPYDGGTTAVLAGTPGTLVGVISGDAVSLSGTAVGTFASPNVGTGITVTVSGQSLTGAQAGNYSLTEPTTMANITGKTLTISGLTANNKTYDQGNTATISGTPVLVGVQSGDSVSLVGTAVGTFASVNVGTGISVSVSGLSLTGAQAGNYSLTQPTLSANITQKNLTISGITANDKPYDGGTTAVLAGTPGTLVGVISGDAVSLSGTAVGTFASPNVGTGITVTVSGQSLTGAQAGNYSLTEPTLSADILNAGPTVTSISPSSKNVGDAGFTLTVTGSNFVASSTVNFNGSPRTTTFASSTELTASILSSDLTTATTSALITVTNPAPGGGTSSAAVFSVIALNTAPTISSITPSSVSVGSPDTVVTIIGTDFLASSTVQFNSADLATTTFASSTQMTATIPAAHLTATSTNSITVTNPAPGGGTSSTQTFSVVTAADTTAPTVTSFSLLATSSALTISISSLSATDNVGVTGYLVTESSTTPAVSNSAWSATAPSSYTFALQGDKTLYAWAKDAAGNISTGVSATTTITYVQVSPGGEQTLLTNGTMSPNNTAASSSNVTFKQAVHVVFGNGSTIVVPLSTVMTASTTSDWTTLLSTNSVSTTDIPSSVTSAGALQWGLPSTAITASQPVTIEIYVGAAFNGRSLSYYRKEAGGTAWTQAGTCTISSGLCQFTTSTFCSFFVGVPVTAPASSAGGGSTVPPTTVTIDGVAFPGASVSVIDKDSPYQTIFTKDVTTGSDGTFHISFVGVLMSQHSYGLIVRDSQGRLSQSKFFNIDTVTNSLTVKDVVVSPTIGFLQTAVTRGNPVTIVGFSTPGSTVHVSLDGTMQKDVTAGSDGSYRLSADTGALDFGGHQARASQTTKAGVTSDFSPTQMFTVAQTSNVSTDLNGDGVTDIKDLSIFLSRWQSTDPAVLKTIDFDGDGRVDLTDFSILLRAIRKQ